MHSPRKLIRPALLSLLALAIVAEMVALTPASLEEEGGTLNTAVDPDTLVQDDDPALAPGIPQNRIAEYAMEKFQFLSVQKGIKQWKIDADLAFLYNPERLVHARRVRTLLFDSGEDQVTIISGKEARYFLNQRDLEIYGNVHTVFPDGFELKSEYLRYLPNEHRIIIPRDYSVQGTSTPQPKPVPLTELRNSLETTQTQSRKSSRNSTDQSRPFQFESKGMDYDMDKGVILLPESARVHFDEPDSPDRTLIESDRCLIHRKDNLAQFVMNSNRPLKSQFVHISQPGLKAKSRRADLFYGDFKDVLQYLTLHDDVLIREKNEDLQLRYSTSGKADFDSDRNVIFLTKYPQVYQDQDTVVGDNIVLHRDTDIVEVAHSNAFSEGSNPDPVPASKASPHPHPSSTASPTLNDPATTFDPTIFSATTIQEAL